MKNSKLSFLRPIFLFVMLGIMILTISRLAIFALYKDRLVEVDNYLEMFSLGFRIDLILMCYLSFIPALVVTVMPSTMRHITTRFLAIYCSIFLFFIFFMELVTPEFIDQYDTRPNKLFLEYLIYPKEVATMLLKGRLITIIIMMLVLALVIWLLKKTASYVFSVPKSTWLVRLIVFPVLGFFLFWGARGSLTSKRPVNASNSVFSNDQLANVMGLNSLYTVAFSLYSLKNETDPAKLYGKMSQEEAITRVRAYMDIPESEFTSNEIPLLHPQDADSIQDRPYNLVIFLQESLGAEYVGCLGGLPLTPNLDSLAAQGLLFTNLYSTGTRSVRGIEAVTTGFLPSPSESVVKLPNAQQDFFTLANLLKPKGYNTSFIYGGMANFDNMASFFSGNGFDDIIDETSFTSDGNKYAMKGTWGYSDEDLVLKANEYFKSLGDQPFFSLMFSSSNHEPFEFPEGRIELYEEPKASVHNAMKYADFAIGKFFELAKNEPYFENTVFVIVADHNTRTYGNHLVPVDKFHIPAVIIAPSLSGERYDKLCSQIDIPVTALSLLGADFEHPMPGRDLLHLPDSVPGRAIMQFHDINAFRVDNEMVIMQPNRPAVQFKLEGDKNQIPMELDDELAKDALAHVLLANYLYKNREYTLPYLLK
ncbi:LTA synthase family protein [Bacteroides propionicifaciens]|uniref:LTA synthase family protein n=2 Tax=Bacteroides propionicifaciens TaxID=392838 RepID=UPI000476CF95|nr:LTA synthase family protein [Bacteroides propionicifaciens]